MLIRYIHRNDWYIEAKYLINRRVSNYVRLRVFNVLLPYITTIFYNYDGFRSNGTTKRDYYYMDVHFMLY